MIAQRRPRLRPILCLILCLILSAALLAACATVNDQAVQFEQQGEWLKAVLAYRKVLAKDPGNTEYKLQLANTELEAANYYYDQGAALLEQGKVDDAIATFQQGLVAQPKHERLKQGLREAVARREAERYYEEGTRLYEAGQPDKAKQAFQRALVEYPDHKGAAAALKSIAEAEKRKREGRFALTSRAPITLNFRQTPIQTAFEFLSKSFGINIIFDDAVDNTPVSLFARSVTFEQALRLLLTTSKTFYKQIGPNTLVIAPDTADKRAQYEDQIVRAFQLNSISSKNMLDILKGVITPKKVVANEELNSLIVRDTQPVLQQVDRLIQLNDRIPAEALIEVEILEVSRTKAMQLGLDLGSQITRSFQPASSFAEAVANDTITLPAITFRYFKQDVDARTLANPKIRVINGKSAHIHIGDRVPLRSSSIQDATGQVRTTYVYTDIGIRLSVEPVIHLDDSVTLKLGLDVSSLGQNLGTASDPAFEIGTRNAETFMRLRNGETVILGGLIRDDERRSRIKVPGLGDIPAVGSIFTSYDNSSSDSEVLLTITPHVMRSWDLPARDKLQFFSGTGNAYSDQPLYSYLSSKQSPPGGTLPEIHTGASAAQAPAHTVPGTTRQVQSSPGQAAPRRLGFDKPLYEATPGDILQVRLTGEQLGVAGGLSAEVLYNGDVLEFVRAEAASAAATNVQVSPSGTPGAVRLQVALAPGQTGSSATPLVTLTLRAKSKGISYLAYRAPKLENNGGQAAHAKIQVGASRVVIH